MHTFFQVGEQEDALSEFSEGVARRWVVDVLELIERVGRELATGEVSSRPTVVGGISSGGGSSRSMGSKLRGSSRGRGSDTELCQVHANGEGVCCQNG